MSDFNAQQAREMTQAAINRILNVDVLLEEFKRNAIAQLRREATSGWFSARLTVNDLSETLRTVSMNADRYKTVEPAVVGLIQFLREEKFTVKREDEHGLLSPHQIYLEVSW